MKTSIYRALPVQRADDLGLKITQSHSEVTRATRAADTAAAVPLTVTGLISSDRWSTETAIHQR